MSDRSDATEDPSLITGSQTDPSGTGSQQITIIVPTRNEAENIVPLLERIETATQDLQVEILFVDDSNDDTAELITDLAEKLPLEIKLLARPPEKRNGLSGAVVDGLRTANCDWVCVMDADLQHPPETIPLLWDQAQRTGADIVVGSRRGDVVGPLGLTRMRSLTSKALTILARMLFPRTLKNVSDPLTGLFLVRRQAVNVDVLRPDGFKILLEILVRCPALHVSEIQFDFAPRQEGESKADVREGVRFFRHLVRLRVTVNPHLVRFIVTIISGVAINGMLLWAMVEGLGLQPLLSAVLAVELFFLWVQIAFQYWVFRDRDQKDLRRGFWGSFLASQLFIILIYLPLLLILASFDSIHYLAANLIALILVGLIRYGLSEQWIWTKGSMVWQHQTYYYSIHGIINLESQVQLAELQYFEKSALIDDVDIQIRLDRHGTPSRLPGGISYDEKLGRFGFGLTVLPGMFTQIIVSPLLERSPNFLFTNIVEPILRWRFVQKGFALVRAAGIAQGNEAVLIHANDDMGLAVSVLCRQKGYAFLADDLIIVDNSGQVYGYPKPVTIQPDMVQEKENTLSGREMVALSARRALYTQFMRRIGLWLSAKEIPAATMNTYLQWLVPQPKHMLADVVEGLRYKDVARMQQIVVVNGQPDLNAGYDEMKEIIDTLQQSEKTNEFQPHPLLAQRLRIWQDEDLMVKERVTIEQALKTAEKRWIAADSEDWWLKLADEISENTIILGQGSHQENQPNHLMQPENAHKEPGNS